MKILIDIIDVVLNTTHTHTHTHTNHILLLLYITMLLIVEERRKVVSKEIEVSLEKYTNGFGETVLEIAGEESIVIGFISNPNRAIITNHAGVDLVLTEEEFIQLQKIILAMQEVYGKE